MQISCPERNTYHVGLLGAVIENACLVKEELRTSLFEPFQIRRRRAARISKRQEENPGSAHYYLCNIHHNLILYELMLLENFPLNSISQEMVELGWWRDGVLLISPQGASIDNPAAEEISKLRNSMYRGTLAFCPRQVM